MDYVMTEPTEDVVRMYSLAELELVGKGVEDISSSPDESQGLYAEGITVPIYASILSSNGNTH